MKIVQGTETGLVAGLEPEQLGNAPLAVEVASALAMVPRYRYLPEDRQMLAGIDEDVPLGRGRRSMAPSNLGRLLELARVRPGTRVMAVGVELGYPVALLDALGAEVTPVESDDALRDAACARLDRTVRSMLPTAESARGERWDAILFLGSVPALPRDPVAMLRPEGRLIVPIRQNPFTELVLIVRGHRGHRRQDLGPIEIARLPPALNG